MSPIYDTLSLATPCSALRIKISYIAWNSFTGLGSNHYPFFLESMIFPMTTRCGTWERLSWLFLI